MDLSLFGVALKFLARELAEELEASHGGMFAKPKLAYSARESL